jgi:hypothetical protein
MKPLLKGRRIRLLYTCCLTGIMTLLLIPQQAAVAELKTLLENDQVRVYEATIKAGAKESGFHTHELPYVNYVQSGGKLNLRYPNGTTNTIELKTGEARWGVVETHAADNPGTADVRLVIIELKQPQSAAGK